MLFHHKLITKDFFKKQRYQIRANPSKSNHNALGHYSLFFFQKNSFAQAFGVTMWELFSYGFQPWAALTGHQILEAIDEPGGQRLEQPIHCPKDHYSIMEACWRHNPCDRPSFAQVTHNLSAEFV